MFWKTCNAAYMRRYASPSSLTLLCRTSALSSPARGFAGLFEESQAAEDSKEVAVFAINADKLERERTIVSKKAFGIPFMISDAQAVDNVCRHHGTSVEIHEVARYMMPFWLTSTSTVGTFKADLLQRDPAFLTQQHCLVWLEGPRYQFSYPFGEFMPINQISASYLHPPSVVEECLTGTHIPSMLVARFELLQELEQMPHRPRVVPFTMSTNTALSLVEKRVNRGLVLDRIGHELRKFHGSFVKSNIMLTSLGMEAVGIRPVFLPLLRLMVTTVSNSTPVPAYVCGATGKVVGPVLHVNRSKKAGLALSATLASLLLLSPVVEPAVATAMAVGCGIGTTALQRWVRETQLVRDAARAAAELKSISILNYASDTSGYRWSAEEEEREEYEYREDLRREARRRKAFEERVKEEAARDHARAHGRTVDAKGRRRHDLENTDPLGLYRLLGLEGRELTASPRDIAKAFRQAVRVHHPDVSKAGSEEVMRKHMQRIIAAYKILRDPKTKKQYDAGELKKGVFEETT